MLGMPEPTAYDLRFRLLGIPVRVHPWFWLTTALLAGQDASFEAILVWIPCVFISILVHEFGHGLMARLFRFSPSIVLYSMGGLCASESERQTPGQRLAVLAAGPGAGLLFYGVLELVYQAFGTPRLGLVGGRAYLYLGYINLYWSLINLLPIWPLDGGQILGVLLGFINRRKGLSWAHVVSLIVASLLALYVFQYVQDILLGMFFTLFAVINFQILQAQHHAAKYSAFEDEGDWWKR